LVICQETKDFKEKYIIPLDTLNISEFSFDKKVIIKSMKAWQRLSYSSNLFNCQYYPSCSNYFSNSIIENGSMLGIIKGSDRIIRCNEAAHYYHMYETYQPRYFVDGRMIDQLNPTLNPNPKKNSITALLLSVVPGLGRAYTGRYVDGLYSFSTIVLFSQLSYNQLHRENHFVSAIFGSLAITFWFGDFYGAWRTTKVKK